MEGLFSLISGEVIFPADTYREIRFQPYGRSGWMVYGEKNYQEVLVGIVDEQGLLHRRQE